LSKTISKVNVKYSGGLSVSSIDMIRPLMRMFVAYAGKMKYRINEEQRLGNNKKTGRYAKLGVTEKKAKNELFWAQRNKNEFLINKWTSILASIQADRAGRRRKYKRLGGLWKGLTVTQQKAGTKITINFQKKSKGRDGKNFSNAKKAWFSMIDKGQHRERIHLFQPTEEEFNTLKKVYASSITYAMIRDVQIRQKFIQQIKKESKSDPKLQSKLASLLKI
jgi:nuclear transport factor 2 (NTF2) superfamily protein